MKVETMTSKDLAEYFDHIFLKAYATKEDFLNCLYKKGVSYFT